MFDLPPPRHISTLRNPVTLRRRGEGPLATKAATSYSQKLVTA